MSNEIPCLITGELELGDGGHAGFLWMEKLQTLPFCPRKNMSMWFRPDVDFTVNEVYWDDMEKRLEIDGEIDGHLSSGDPEKILELVKRFWGAGWFFRDVSADVSESPAFKGELFDQFKRQVPDPFKMQAP